MPRGYILPNAAVGETGIIYRKNNDFGQQQLSKIDQKWLKMEYYCKNLENTVKGTAIGARKGTVKIRILGKNIHP